jgi:hypothetical protein
MWYHLRDWREDVDVWFVVTGVVLAALIWPLAWTFLIAVYGYDMLKDGRR